MPEQSSPWRGQDGVGKQDEEEGAVERRHHGLTPRLYSPSPCSTRGEEVEDLGMKE